MQEIIREAMEAGISLRQSSAQTLHEPLLKAAETMVLSLESGGKILVCGNGGSAADAQHFAGELVNRFEMDRRGLAAIAMTSDASVITSISNDFSFDNIFSRQVEALGRDGDVLLAISTSGNSVNVLNAVTTAEKIGMQTIALTGGDGGSLAKDIESLSVHLNIAHDSTPRVQEMHITCLHILCSLIDEMMFGGKL